MLISKLSAILSDSYYNAPDKQVALSIHMFGIKFVDELKGQSIAEICEMANVPKSYGTEIRKGMKIAKYVVLKDLGTGE